MKGWWTARRLRRCLLGILLLATLLFQDARVFVHVEREQEIPTTPQPVAPPTAYPTPAPTPDYKRAKKLDRKVTIVIQLSGEMANNLHHIAHGFGLQLLAKEEFNIETNLVLRHHEGPNNRAPKPKWKSARDNIQECFPTLSEWDFSEGNNKKIFSQRETMQRMWLKGKMDHMFGLINSQHIFDVRKGLQLLAEDILVDPGRPYVEAESSMRLPYLLTETLDVFPMVDQYFDQILPLFQFNKTACCAQVPNVDDSVFHYRNYESEMPERRAYNMGFAELSPQKVSDELFQELQPGNSVKITTRLINQKARNYAEALEAKGVHASVITDQSGVQDFCFLREAKKELVGNARSTFVIWAALLGNATRARLYHVDNRGLRNKHPDFWERFTYNFTHPSLSDRIIFEQYKSDED